MSACTRCGGKGWYWRVPDGFNPFYAGGFSTARAMYRVECNRCHLARAQHGLTIGMERGERKWP